MKNHLLVSAVIIGAIGIGDPAIGKELYVDNVRGADSVSYASNSPDQPWRTLGRAVWGSTSRTAPVAAEAARAGDIVIVAGGIYDTGAGTSGRTDPIYNPVNTGSGGNPIVFRSAISGAAQLRATTSPSRQPIIGTNGRSFIVWDGFLIDEQYVPTAPDTGPVVVWASNNVVLQNLTIRNVNRGWVDNHNAIRVEQSTAISIRNNSISGEREPQHGYNASGITMYWSRDVVVENNDFSQSNSGIYLKGFNRTGIVIRNNKFMSVGIGIQLGGVEDVQIYRNIFDQCYEGAIVVSVYNSESGVNNATIVNNTLMRSAAGDFGGITYRGGESFWRSISVSNNILGRGRYGMAVWPSSVPPQISSQYNAFYSNVSQIMIAWQSYPLSTWQSTYRKDLLGSAEVSPRFVNESGLDYRLAPSSPLIGAGIDILDLDRDGLTSDGVNIGAYATGSELIGRSTDNVSPPNPPNSISVQ